MDRNTCEPKYALTNHRDEPSRIAGANFSDNFSEYLAGEDV
jgi:hypothetical protein